MKELFSRIESGVHIEPETKILPASAFTTLMDADAVLEQAKLEVEAFRKKARKEAKVLKEKQSALGFAEGLSKWTAQLGLLEKAHREMRNEMQRQVVALVVQCGKKILGRELKLSSTAIVDIVAQALKPVATHKHATIFVCKKDADALEENKKRLQEELERTETLVIQVRHDIEPGGCVIETEAGIINAQVHVLWESLEIALTELMKK